MNGCKLTIKKEEQPPFQMSKGELKTLIGRIFSKNQLSVMNIDYDSAGCFIATAACGIDSEEVVTLRTFRDMVLMRSGLGGLFVYVYYLISPPIARLIEESPRVRYLVRHLLVGPLQHWWTINTRQNWQAP